MGGLSRKTTVTFAGVMLLGAMVGAGIGYAASTVTYDSIARIRVIQSEFASGFDSGFHTHPGPVIVQVQEGSFKIYQGSCEPTVVSAGQTYFEVPLVPVRAVATGHIRWTTSQILPTDATPQTIVTSPCP